jgi:hypothetical protein
MTFRPPSRESLLRMKNALEAVSSAYRAGDYATALDKTEDLKNGSEATAPYCFFRGSMLHYLGRFSEAEASLREGLFLEEKPRQRALAFNTLASVLTASRGTLQLLNSMKTPAALGLIEDHAIAELPKSICAKDASFKKH